jgi:transcriptional regulator with XRE-family HTH domain
LIFFGGYRLNKIVRTYPKITSLIQGRLKEISQRQLARELDMPLLSVQRYLKGSSEPNETSLEKLSAHFEVMVSWLRGEDDHTLEEARTYYRTIKGALYGAELSAAEERMKRNQLSGLFRLIPPEDFEVALIKFREIAAELRAKRNSTE